MNFKRIGRILICLLLVCALVVGLSPIKAQAVVVPQSGMYPEEIVIRAVVGAIGVLAGEDPSAFDDICNSIRALWDAAGYIVTGCVQLFNFANGNGPLYIRQDLIEMARDYLWDSGAIVSAPYELQVKNYTFTSSGPINTFESQVYQAGTGDKYYRYVNVYSPGNLNVSPSGLSGTTIEIDGVKYLCRVVNLGGGFVYDETLPTGYGDSLVTEYINTNGFTELEVSEGLVAAYIGVHGVALSSAYPSWIPTQIYDEELGVDVDHYPLGLGQTVEQTMGMTQEQIWSGEILGELEEIQQTQVTQSFLQQLLQQPIQTLGSILEELISIPGKILGGLGQILIDVLTYLFVPAQDFLQLKIQALVQEFGYLEPIISLGDTFKAYFTGVNPTPPVIWIDLGASAWYPMGGRVKFIDLTWYAQYKPTVDGIIGAFLWLWLLWRLFQNAPGIVRGASGMFGKPDSHPDSSFSTRSE